MEHLMHKKDLSVDYQVLGQEPGFSSRISDSKKRKVAKRACLACREKKIKCDGESRANPNGGPGICTNCANSGNECVFVASMRGGRRVSNKMKHELAQSGMQSRSVERNSLGNAEAVWAREDNEGITNTIHPMYRRGEEERGFSRETSSQRYIPDLRVRQKVPGYGNTPHSSGSLPSLDRNAVGPDQHALSTDGTIVPPNDEHMYDYSFFRYPNQANQAISVYPQYHGQNVQQLPLSSNGTIHPLGSSLHHGQEGITTPPVPVSHAQLPVQVGSHVVGSQSRSNSHRRSSFNYGNNNFYSAPGSRGSKIVDLPVNHFPRRSQVPAFNNRYPFFSSNTTYNNWYNACYPNSYIPPDFKPSTSFVSLRSDSYPTYKSQESMETASSEMSASKPPSSIQERPKLRKYGAFEDLSPTSQVQHKIVTPNTTFSNTNESNRINTNKSSLNRASWSETVFSPSLHNSANKELNGEFRNETNTQNDAMVKTDLPPWPITYRLFELFFDYVHPKIRVLPSKIIYVDSFNPKVNISLTYSIFLCSFLFLQSQESLSPIEQYNASELEYIEMILKHWDGLDILATVQTLNLLVYYFLSSKMDIKNTVKYLDILLRTIKYSNIVALFNDKFDLPNYLKISTNHALTDNILMLMNIWTAFTQIGYARLIFTDENIMRDTLTSIGGDENENLEEIILPKSLLVSLPRFAACQQFSLDVSLSESPNKCETNIPQCIHIKDLEKNLDNLSVPSTSFIGYLMNIYRLWLNKGLDSTIAWEKIRSFDVAINRKFYSVEDNNQLLVIDSDALNAIALSEGLKLQIKKTNVTLDLLFCDVFESHIDLPHILKLREIVVEKIPNFEASTIISCFQTLIRVLDIICLVELGCGKIPSCSTLLCQVPNVILAPTCANFSEDKSDDHLNFTEQDDMKWWKDPYEKLKKQQLTSVSQKVDIWLKYPTFFLQLLRFALPKLVNYIIWFKFLKFVKFDGSCTLIYDNKSIPLDQSQFNVDALVSSARSSLCFGDNNLSDDSLFTKLLSVIEVAFLKEKFNILIDFAKILNMNLEHGEKYTKNIEELSHFLNDVIGFTL